jgi:1-acyl-sn-glycerol-3-phosphate acyltransferase
MDIYYNTAKGIIRIFQTIFLQDCHVHGENNLPFGAKIIAGNHPHATDALFLPFVFREKLHFFVQGDLFDIPFIGWLLAKADQIPVLPNNKLLAFEQAERHLKLERAIAIFPEARLNPERNLMRSGTGAVQLSLTTGAPIIPVGFYVPAKYLHYIERQKKDRISKGHWQTHGHCYLHIGSPWLPGGEIGQLEEPASRRELTRQLMDLIEVQAMLARQDCANETGEPIDDSSNVSQS